MSASAMDSMRFTEAVRLMNAPAAFIVGITHEIGHFDQMREVAQQAVAARQQANN